MLKIFQRQFATVSLAVRKQITDIAIRTMTRVERGLPEIFQSGHE